MSDCVAAVPTVALALLLLRRDLELWHIYLAVALGAAAGAFQWPAYAASTTLLVPQRQLACAAGMVELARAGSTILAPLLAGALLLRLELWHLLLLDTATFLVAVALLQTVRIPRPAPSAAGQARGTLWQESLLGWRYLAARPGLFYLLGYFSFLNFSVALVLGLTTPMMLAFTTADVLGATLSAGALGMFLGGLTLTAWGGPRRKAAGALGFGFLLGAGLILAGARPSPGLITAGLFAFYFAIPIINGCSQAIWQTKTPPDLQGRVFAIRRMCATFTAPLAYLVAGPLADRVFEPVLAAGGLLTGSLGQLTGVGPGRGIGAMLVFQGALSLLVAALGLRTPRLVRVEEELPDALGRPAAER